MFRSCLLWLCFGLWFKNVILEIACAVRFSPQTDFPRDRWAKDRIVCRKQIRIRCTASRLWIGTESVFDCQRPIEISLQVGAVHRQFQLMPCITINVERLITVAES